MLKNIFLALVLLTAVQTISYTQEQTPSVDKALSVYIYGGSGNINPQAGKLLNLWSESGMVYSQNFANAKWLSVDTTIALCTETGSLLTAHNGDTVGSPKASYDIVGYGLVNLNFDKYFTLGVHITGRMDTALKYKFKFIGNQSFTIKNTYEFYFTGNSLYATLQTEKGSNTRHIINHMDIRTAYAVAFHPRWAFETEVRFRTKGSASLNGKADSGKALAENFNIRWNNTLAYSDPNGFGGYLQLRYEPTNIITDIKHNLKLSGGISYSYDLSAL